MTMGDVTKLIAAPLRNGGRRKIGWMSSVLLALLCGCGSAGQADPPATIPAPGISSSAHGAIAGFAASRPLRKPAFTLRTTSGSPFTFRAATAGKLTYLYFGYTHCPDACPITMATLSAAIREQSAAVRHRIVVVFVTVDPARDTGPVLAAWLDNFYPGIVGLTGTQAAIQSAEKAAGVKMAEVERDPGTDYTVQHSAIVIAYSPDGLAHAVYPEGTKPETFSHDMPLLLSY